MVQINSTRGRKIYYPGITKKLTGLRNDIRDVLNDYSFEEELHFPAYSPLRYFEEYYSDINLELLVDFLGPQDQTYAFNPEYRSVIKYLNKKILKSITNYKFQFNQVALSYLDMERTSVKEDEIIGCATVNPLNDSDSWSHIAKATKEIALYVLGKEHTLSFTNQGSIEVSYKNTLVGFAKNDGEHGVHYMHFSLNDILDALDKKI